MDRGNTQVDLFLREKYQIKTIQSLLKKIIRFVLHTSNMDLNLESLTNRVYEILEIPKPLIDLRYPNGQFILKQKIGAAIHQLNEENVLHYEKEGERYYQCVKFEKEQIDQLKDLFFEYKLSKRYKKFVKEVNESEKKRKQFTKNYSSKRILSINLDEYVIGKGSVNSFCYMVERELSTYGGILGGTATKFGIYYDKKNAKYQVSKIWKKANINKSFEQLKLEVKKVIDLSIDNKPFDIGLSELSNMFKYKIAYLFNPDKFISIYSEGHINRLLDVIELNQYKDEDLLTKRQIIFNLKKLIAPNDKNNVFIDFVYENYRDQLYLDENLENALKLTDKLVKIEVGSLTEKTTTNKVSRSRKKPDYDEINRKKGIQGALAEKKVLEYELELLKDVSLPKNKKPKIVSKNSSLGYDILSYTLDGKPKKIEVKSKSGGSLTNIDFFITQNEYQKIEEAKEKKEIFSIYYVFSLYKNPKFIEIEWKDIMNLKNEVVAYRYLLTTK